MTIVSRSKKFYVRLSEREFAILTQASNKQGISVSALMRQAALANAHTVILVNPVG
ncbi:MAG: hypothetical protein KME49_27420 [Brasilonema octagenarum HA4186-MV1]|nr:hypothetical protein [Brasilonema octagenarum HA4186-MV1]